MLIGAVMNIEIGDYVRLAARERPFTVGPDAWWQVIEHTERGLDCVHLRGGIVGAMREGVPLRDVIAHRKPDRPEAA